jgi:hypothetical protein
MISLIPHRGLAAILALAVAFALPVFAAQPERVTNEKRPPPDEIVIKNGMLEHNGQRTPATLERVIDLIAPAYKRLTVRMVGASNVVIRDDVTLRLPRRQIVDGKEVEPSLHSLFAALRAASGNRFQVQAFSDYDFLLSADAHYAQAGRTAEVFKLGHLISGPTGNPGLQADIDQVEAERAVLSKRYGDKHPKMAELTDRLEVLKAMRARATSSRTDSVKLLDQIQEVVRDTLERLKPGEPAPEFKYHAGTGLLVVIGSEEAVAVTRKVVDALN